MRAGGCLFLPRSHSHVGVMNQALLRKSARRTLFGVLGFLIRTARDPHPFAEPWNLGDLLGLDLRTPRMRRISGIGKPRIFRRIASLRRTYA
jgi:hypothetical protein